MPFLVPSFYIYLVIRSVYIYCLLYTKHTMPHTLNIAVKKTDKDVPELTVF